MTANIWPVLLRSHARASDWSATRSRQPPLIAPFSLAGVHRRAVRRAYGIGANLGYRGFYHRNFGSYAYNRFGYGTAAYGAGWGRRLGRLGLESASLQQRSHRLGRRLGLESPLASVAIDNRWNG